MRVEAEVSEKALLTLLDWTGYGPRMNSSDGRLVSNFIVAALRGEDLQVYGDGTATRSLMVSCRLDSLTFAAHLTDLPSCI